MANGKDIAWKPIGLCLGVGIVGLIVGALVAGPALQKYRAKRQAAKKNAGDSATDLKKAA